MEVLTNLLTNLEILQLSGIFAGIIALYWVTLLSIPQKYFDLDKAGGIALLVALISLPIVIFNPLIKLIYKDLIKVVFEKMGHKKISYTQMMILLTSGIVVSSVLIGFLGAVIAKFFVLGTWFMGFFYFKKIGVENQLSGLLHIQVSQII